MRTRPFGKSGIQVSELVFGGGYVGGIIIHADDDIRRRAIRRAIDAGVNWIDTAESYGNGKSEEALGWLLAELPAAERPHLSTKVRLDTARLDDIPGQIERALDGSLRRLGTDRVTLYQLHNALGRDGFELEHVLGAGGVCESFERLKRDGTIRLAGFTALGDPGQCRAVIESGRVDSAQVYYNLLNPSAGRPVPAKWSTQDFQGLIGHCAAHGVAVMNIRTFAAGAVTEAGRHGREVPITPNSDYAAERARADRAFAVLGGSYGTRAQTALRFSLANPEISCVVIGLAELAHLEEALAAAEMGPLPAEAVAAMEPLWASDFGAGAA